jgi:hypothetical protein
MLKSEDEMWLNIFETEMANIVSNKAGAKIVSITTTTKEQVKSVIREVLEDGRVNGYGIEKIKQNLVKEVGKDLRGNAYARARAIAQTEMISASNQAALLGAESTKMEYRKFWSTSGQAGVRETHTADQEFSNRVDGLKKDEIFPNTQLLYPGDPGGLPGEVINCRCTLLTEIL